MLPTSKRPDWWNRHRERIALIQVAFRAKERIKVFIIDALADFDPEPLRLPLEKSAVVKIINNAGFNVTRLQKNYNFSLDPIFDTMLAARRSGERKYSLKAQAETLSRSPARQIGANERLEPSPA